METIIQKIDPENFCKKDLDKACEILQSGGLVAFPTETVYGLGGDALRAEASAKIYAAKGRPSDNPLIIHIAETEQLSEIAEDIPDAATKLAEAFWPGPLTMILKKGPKVPLSTTGGLDTVAIRMPEHPVAAALIRESGVYIAAPSANTSGRPSPTKAEHVIEDLSGKIDMIIDGGTVGIGLESTIIDLTGAVPMILRPGYITKAMAERVIGEISVDPALLSRSGEQPAVAKAPGMKYRHYAPKGNMTIIAGPPERVAAKINALSRERAELGHCVAIIATEESRAKYQYGRVYSVGSREKKGSIAAGLYDILREMDHIGAEYIYAESFQDDALGGAVMNRLLKAAAYQVIQV